VVADMARSIDFSDFIEVGDEETMTHLEDEGSEEIMESIKKPVSLSQKDWCYK
jgi:hypothetical protein